MTCRVTHGQQLTNAFEVQTGVRQGCLLSPFLFLFVKEWVMKTSTAWTQLDDLALADDLALLAHTQQQMQGNTNMVAANSAHLSLNIHKGKSKVLKINTANDTSFMLEWNN